MRGTVVPKGLPEGRSRVYRTTDYRGGPARARLYGELQANRYALMGIVCSSEPIMTRPRAWA